MQSRLVKWLLISLFLVHSKAEACFILFYRSDQHTLVGNHEDWFATDAAVRINPPSSETYGSVVFTFESEGWAQGGMNDQGLFFDGAYTPFQEVTFDSHVQPFPGYIWQAMLDNCKSVREALSFLKKYELEGLSESHIMLADAEGNGVVLGVENGKLAIKERNEPYLLQTNFNPWHPELSDEPVCDRYQSALMYLSQDADFERMDLMNILEATHQEELTVYSNVYDLQNRTITTFNKRDFGNPIEIDFKNVFNRGSCIISLDSLAADKHYVGKCQDDSILELFGTVSDEFLKTYNFLNELDISYLHVFTYSERPNTPAISMDGEIPLKERNDRSKMLRGLSEKKKRYFYENHLNKSYTVLFEEDIEDGKMHGFTENYIRIAAKFDPLLVNETKLVSLKSINAAGHVEVEETEEVMVADH